MISITHNRYRHLAIDCDNPGPSDEAVRKLEALLEARLPQAFKDYLQVANGGHHEYSFDVPTGQGGTEPMSFSGLFSASDDEASVETFISEIHSARQYANMPKGVLPFARDGGGSVLYLDLTDEGKGRVIAFVHGLPEWAGARSESALIELAASFDDYIDRLYISRDDVIDRLEHDAGDAESLAGIIEQLDIGMPEWKRDVLIADAVTAAKQRLS